MLYRGRSSHFGTDLLATDRPLFAVAISSKDFASMNTWQAIALVCIGIGAAVVERAFRDTPRDRLVDPVLFAVTMLILAPFLLAYLLALVVSQPLVTLWRGKSSIHGQTLVA